MNTKLVDKDIKNMQQHMTCLKKESVGAERVWAHRNLMLLQQDYYSTDEVMDLAEQNQFTVYDPFTKIRRGTEIRYGSIIEDGSMITGKNVVLGESVILNGAIICGNNITIGNNNKISDKISVDNLITGNGNILNGINGVNLGKLVIGDENILTGIKVANESTNSIMIGNNNQLCEGLNLNIPFAHGSIFIGHYNILGRDGGGVISCSYRFGKKWYGTVAIGIGVETTRGAEILGYSAIGWPAEALQQFLGLSEDSLAAIFTTNKLADVADVVNRLTVINVNELYRFKDVHRKTSLFGIVKTKRCLLTEGVTIKDDTRVTGAFLKDVTLQERNKVCYTSVRPSQRRPFVIPVQGRVFENMEITNQEIDWNLLPQMLRGKEYPDNDEDFFCFSDV